MRKQILLFFPLLLLPILIFSQTLITERECETMPVLDRLIGEDPTILDRIQDLEDFTEDYIATQSNTAGVRQVYTIPTVVHVVYNNSAENISTALIQSQIDVLNADFRTISSAAAAKWGVAADTEIEFCLASVDPNGNPTDGITRTATSVTAFGSNDAVKFDAQGGKDAWPASDYLNIWVCDLSGGLLGYAQFPNTGAAATDGVVNDYLYTGVNSAGAPYDGGRTCTHEVGHWLNLRHIWGDGPCNRDDFVSDTPKAKSSTSGCPSNRSECGSLNMVENYMDYSYDACMNLFTEGQKSRMRATFAPGGPRASLLNSNGCGSPSGGGPTCRDNVMNGNETGVDCGGPDCPPCSTPPTCNDNVMNGNETGVDCGGPDCPPCAPAPTCSDNVMNGNETGVDCGGPDCPPCSTGSCDAPSGLFANSIKPKRAKLNWSAVSGATNYTIEIRTVGGSWSSASTANTNISATGLSNGTTYEWRVQATCSGSTSDWSVICSFTAGDKNSGDCGNTRVIASEEMKVYPNPASNVLHVDYRLADNTSAQLAIVDMYGRMISVQTVTYDVSNLSIDTQNLSNGMYLIRIENENGETQTQRFVISK